MTFLPLRLLKRQLPLRLLRLLAAGFVVAVVVVVAVLVVVVVGVFAKPASASLAGAFAAASAATVALLLTSRGSGAIIFSQGEISISLGSYL